MERTGLVCYDARYALGDMQPRGGGWGKVAEVAFFGDEENARRVLLVRCSSARTCVAVPLQVKPPLISCLWRRLNAACELRHKWLMYSFYVA